MKREPYVRLLIAIVVAAVILGGTALLSSGSASGWLGAFRFLTAQEVTVSGDYQGSAELQGVFPGVYTDAAATPSPIDLGEIDLALHLDQSGNQISGHVMLDHTLVFTREHTIMVTPAGPTPGPGTPAPTPAPLDIGPYVQGTFDGTTLQLDSESFTMALNEREITRQFRLVSTGVRDGGATIEGKYLETLWGYALEPSTAVGHFSMRRPVYGSVAPTEPGHPVYLPLITKQ